MAGLGAAFLFVPLFYYLGVPLAEATPAALLLNVVSLLFAATTYWRAKLINWRVGLPVLVTAVILSPMGALLTPHVDKSVLLWMFAGFLVFAGVMMLFFQARKREKEMGRAIEAGAGVGVGGVAGFLGGLLGISPVLVVLCAAALGIAFPRRHASDQKTGSMANATFPLRPLLVIAGGAVLGASLLWVILGGLLIASIFRF